VVARGMGKPCVSAASGLAIDYRQGRFTVGGHTVAKGDRVTIDGSAGTVMLGAVPTVDPQLSGEFATLMGWADERRRLKVRTNAETPQDARTALRFGAEGIGLCRTEHMFFDDARILAMREMILAGDADGRRAALARILPMQRQDFVELFEIMAGLPVTIRLLDPPLHEFLPEEPKELEAIARAAGVEADALRRRAAELREVNPMLGLRGCRLGVLFPEIYEMQARAIFGAAVDVAQSAGEPVVPEIMVPLIATTQELALIKTAIDAVATEAMAETGLEIAYQVGTMIEVPRAALRAEEIAGLAEFFSFGTNDLTQMALGLSRDDSAKFMELYLQRGIFDVDPFTTLDVDGVGALVELACERGRRGRPDLKLGICGEHGGDPATIAFCERVGLDYVSCSPYRVPIARLAAAQATLRVEKASD
jgi:pyruvate, orthophosphate dikinase